MKLSDKYDSKENLTVTRPESVLNKIVNKDELQNVQKSFSQKDKLSSNLVKNVQIGLLNSNNNKCLDVKYDMSKIIRPMLSTLVNQPFNSRNGS